MDKSVRIPMDNHLEFKTPTNQDEISILFGRWLLHYFYPWNPDDDTWIDVDKKGNTTIELFEEFKKEILNEQNHKV